MEKYNGNLHACTSGVILEQGYLVWWPVLSNMLVKTHPSLILVLPTNVSTAGTKMYLILVPFFALDICAHKNFWTMSIFRSAKDYGALC